MDSLASYFEFYDMNTNLTLTFALDFFPLCDVCLDFEEQEKLLVAKRYQFWSRLEFF